jgi:hypothetical protein
MKIMDVTLEDLKTMGYSTAIWFRNKNWISGEVWLEFVNWWNSDESGKSTELLLDGKLVA